MNRECMICMEETKFFVIFECGHEVCEACYPKVLDTNPECPLCRAQLRPMLPPTPTNNCNCFCGAIAVMCSLMILYIFFGIYFFSRRTE